MTGGMRKKWIRKVWHGTAHPEEAADHEVLEQRMKVFAVYALLFLLLTVVRYSLGFSSVDGGVLHARVVEALLGGDNWGRQALVASQEFPLIPTVTLLGAEVVAVPLGLTGTHLLVAVVQVWTLSYLVRLTPAGWMARLLGVVIVGIMLLFPFFRDTWAVSDPHWVVAVPLMAMVYHGVCWTDTEQLRDVVMVGVAAGILVFCGFTGIFLSLVMLALFTMQLRHSRSLTARDIYGVRFVLWAPWCYCLALSLLLSWLIMGDPWPGWERLVDQIRIVSLEVFRQECWTLAGALSPAMAAAAAMGVLTVKTPIQKMGIWLVTGLVSVLVTGVVLNSVKVFAAGFSGDGGCSSDRFYVQVGGPISDSNSVLPDRSGIGDAGDCSGYAEMGRDADRRSSLFSHRLPDYFPDGPVLARGEGCCAYTPSRNHIR